MRILIALLCSGLTAAAVLPIVTNVDHQPLHAQAMRVQQALETLGTPLSERETQVLGAASNAESIQRVLDRHCLFGISINPEMRVKAQQGEAAAELDEQGWRVFLIKVANESGTTARLRVASLNARKLAGATAAQVNDAWLDMALFDQQPLKPALSGLAVEYRVIQLYSRDAGKREAKFSFDVGQGTQDLGFRSEADVLFSIRPAREVRLSVKDEDGAATMAGFVIRDRQGRVYPAQSKRLAPDFAFHPQVYRADGETIRLPDGEYRVEVTRGPEYLATTSTHRIGSATNLTFKLKRWIDPAAMGWWSGDHHIHAAGCAHYVKPTEGVLAEDMIRHCRGEDLKIGANLTWGPCFDYQKQFFCGAIDKVSVYPYLLRYDIEVSGFGSHESGHLCLLRLREEIYPGGTSKDHWPRLGLNTLRWAKKQGALTGPAHSGWGLAVKGSELPSYEVPPFDGIGANEYIVDVTHELPGPDGKPMPAVDFISTVDTPYVWELNIWYHTLNAGFRTRISGETDFPCIYGERVGLGRSYVKLPGKLDYDSWCEGIREGRNYVGDGKSHIIDFRVNDVLMGHDGSELRRDASGDVRVTAKVAALLGDKPDEVLRKRPYTEKPYWDIERARVADTRTVPVEVIVNGVPVGRTNIVADGEMRDIAFSLRIERSSWVALRILPSSHSNPVFVIVDGKPIRERKSIEWCAKGVEQCWSQKKRFIPEREMADARAAYDHAREVYRKRLEDGK